jgi:hypothetical protein
MDIPIDKILTDESERIVGSLTYEAYRLYLQGMQAAAAEMLVQAHVESFTDPERPNITTGKLVAEIYRELGQDAPEDRADCDPAIVREAARRRVDAYLDALERIAATGILTRDEPLRVSPGRGGSFTLRSCGYNDLAAWAAAGHETVPGCVIEPARELTVCCCWDGRDYYPREYVEILHRAVSRRLAAPFAFTVFVGPEALRPGRLAGLDSAITVVSVGLPYWWSGMVAWQKRPPGTDSAAILYLDLDLVIVGDLMDIANYNGEHVFMKDYPGHCCPPGCEHDGNASVALIRNGAGQAVWAEYDRLGKPVWDPLDPPRDRLLPLAVQSIVNDPRLGIRHATFPERWVSSYRLWVSKYGLPEDCRVVSFHGRPKPHEFVGEHAWIAENWQ